MFSGTNKVDSGLVNAVDTGEFALRFSACLVYHSALRARPAGVAWINSGNRDSLPHRLAANEHQVNLARAVGKQSALAFAADKRELDPAGQRPDADLVNTGQEGTGPQLRRGSEIRLVGDGNAIVEQMLVVLGADVFEYRALHAPIAPLAPPGLIESIRIVHLEDDF
jgi:hypothetical protein